MIPQEYLHIDVLLEQVKCGEKKLSFPLEYTLEQIEKLKKKMPKSYDNIARILAMSCPIVELVLFEMDYQEPVRPPGSRGRPALSEKPLLLVELLSQTFISDSYRQAQRVLNTHPSWLKALGLKKAPDHTTLSKFRKRRGPEFFDKYFHQLKELLYGFGLVDPGDDVIIDSAPIKASQNFARSNSGIKINEARVREFFNTVDFTPAVKLIAPPSNHGRPQKYSNEVILKFNAFEKLCGFLSRSQALTYLKKHPQVAGIIGFMNGDIPTSSTIGGYINRIPPISWLMRVLVEPITDFFDSQQEYDDEDPLSFFFRSF